MLTVFVYGMFLCLFSERFVLRANVLSIFRDTASLMSIAVKAAVGTDAVIWYCLSYTIDEYMFRYTPIAGRIGLWPHP